MKNVINSILAALFLLSAAQLTQAQTPYWANRLGGAAGDNRATVCKIGHNGNVVIAGYFSGTADFDFGTGTANLTSNGDRDCFIASYTPAGSLNWAVNLGGSDKDQIRDLALDGNDNVLVTGSFRGQNVDFDPSASGTALLSEVGNTIGSNGDHGEIFFAKFSPAGNYVWAMATGSMSEYEYGTAIAADAAGNIYAAGRFHNDIDIDPSAGTYTLSSSQGQTCFLAKYSPSGQLIRGFNFGGQTDNFIRGLETDNNGFVYITGYFQGMNIDFNPAPSVATALNATGGNDIYLAKYDTAFNMQFAYRLGGNGLDEALDLVLDTASNIYITGYVEGAAAFDPIVSNLIPVPGQQLDAFIAKYNSLGQYQWAKVFGGSSDDLGNELRVFQNKLFATGEFHGIVDFDPGPASTMFQSAGDYDGYISQYDLNGNFQCGFRLGGSSDDFCQGVATGASGELYIAGEFQGTNVDFNPMSATLNLTSSGAGDVFLAKYAPCETPNGIAALPDEQNIVVYPNPSAGQFNIKLSGLDLSRKYSIRLTNSLGQTLLSQLISRPELNLAAAPGLYLVTITDEQEQRIYNQRLLVQ